MSQFFKNIYPKGRFLKHVFHDFFSQDIIALLEKFGVKTDIERGERVFPVSDRAYDVVDALLEYVNRQNIEIRYNTKAEKLLTKDNRIAGIEISHNNKTEQISASHVIICTGGKSYPATGSTGDGYSLASSVGHTIETPRPALVPLETKGDTAQQLQGLTLKNVTAHVWINGKKGNEMFGEMIFTHFGLSGPIILTLSNVVVDALNNSSEVAIVIDLKPALDEQKLDNRLLRDLEEHSKKSFKNICKQWLPAKLIPVFIAHTGIDESKNGSQITAKERKKIKTLLKGFSFPITGYRDFNEAIITAGGVSTDEIDAKTMESKLIKGLYCTGEVLNLHGNTGGFNLQIAWSTGWVAGKVCALYATNTNE